MKAHALPTAASRAEIRSVILASTTLPFADRSNATILASALSLPDQVMTMDVTGSQHAGTTALLNAAQAANRGGKTLVVAADRRLARPGSDQESGYGHAAAAFVMGDDAGMARLVAHRHYAADFVDHYRMADQSFDYTLEERWIREAGWQQLVPPIVAKLLNDAGVEPREIRHLIVPAPLSVGHKLAGLCGIDPDRCGDTLENTCGYTGTGHALLMLAGVLEQAEPDEYILLIGFGQGVDAVLLQTTARVKTRNTDYSLRDTLAAKRAETSYTRFLSHCGVLSMDFGMRAERDSRTAHTTAWRKHEDLLALTAGRCPHCGTVQYPKARVCVAPECRKPGPQQAVSLAETTGRIKTFTEDWLAFSPNPPLVYGNVSFEGGGNIFMEFADFEPGEAAVGMPVRCVFRLKDIDRTRHFRRYFWKAAPIAASTTPGGT